MSTTALSFNTLYAELQCPFCEQKILSGVGFRLGMVGRFKYAIGDKIRWDGPRTRPAERPHGGNIKGIGYFNCDNIRCGSWRNCYPDVQQALITVVGDVLVAVEVYKGKIDGQDFDIIEPKGLS